MALSEVKSLDFCEKITRMLSNAAFFDKQGRGERHKEGIRKPFIKPFINAIIFIFFFVLFFTFFFFFFALRFDTKCCHVIAFTDSEASRE